MSTVCIQIIYSVYVSYHSTGKIPNSLSSHAGTRISNATCQEPSAEPVVYNSLYNDNLVIIREIESK